MSTFPENPIANTLNQHTKEEEGLQAVQDNTVSIQRNTNWLIVSTVVSILAFGWGLFSHFNPSLTSPDSNVSCAQQESSDDHSSN